MCHSVLTLCPTCKSNIRQFYPCPSGPSTSSSFKYTTTLTATVCSTTNSLISVHFATGTCSDCLRYAAADAKAIEIVKASLAEWSSQLDALNQRTLHQRTSLLRPPPTAHCEKRDGQDREGGRKALLRLWYNDAKSKTMLSLIRGEGVGHQMR